MLLPIRLGDADAAVPVEVGPETAGQSLAQVLVKQIGPRKLSEARIKYPACPVCLVESTSLGFFFVSIRGTTRDNSIDVPRFPGCKSSGLSVYRENHLQIPTCEWIVFFPKPQPRAGGVFVKFARPTATDARRSVYTPEADLISRLRVIFSLTHHFLPLVMADLRTVNELIAGSVGGAAQVLVGQPLDTIKTRAQIAPRERP